MVDGANSVGDNYKQTIQWLSVMILLVFLNYLLPLFVDYPKPMQQSAGSFYRYSLSNLYLISSFIPSVMLLEYRLEFSYVWRIVIMAVVFLFILYLTQLSFLFELPFLELPLLERIALCLNFFPLIHLLNYFRKESSIGAGIIPAVILLANSLFYLNMYVGNISELDYLIAVYGFIVSHILAIRIYIRNKAKVASPKDYTLGSLYPILEEPYRVNVSPDLQSDNIYSGYPDQQGKESRPETSLRVRLINYLENEKPFLNKDFSMEQLSEYLNTNKTYLSKIINVEMDRNFRDLINYYRVKEAIRIFSENDELTIKELQDMVGFNNASSFTSAFKVNTGSTPGEWCKDTKSKRRTENGQIKV